MSTPGGPSGTGHDTPREWLVQRRLPGTQGANGCWQDYPPVEAASATEAVLSIAEGESDHMLHTEFRVQPMPEFERFQPYSETTHERNVYVR